MPETTLPNGAKPLTSRRLLSTRLMKIWVVRVLGPAVAKVTKPRRFVSSTGSSGMVRLRPALAHRGLTVDPELDHEALDGAEELHPVVEPRPHQVVEAVRPVRRPGPLDLDDEAPLRGHEPRPEHRRRLRREPSRLEQRRGRSAGAADRQPREHQEQPGHETTIARRARTVDAPNGDTRAPLRRAHLLDALDSDLDLDHGLAGEGAVRTAPGVEHAEDARNDWRREVHAEKR